MERNSKYSYEIDKRRLNQRRLCLKMELINVPDGERVKIEPRALATLVFEGNEICNMFTVEDLRKLDFSNVSTAGLSFIEEDISYTNFVIYPQKIFSKSLYKTNAEGVKTIYGSLKGVMLQGANLKNTNLIIYTKEIMCQENGLVGTNTEGCTVIDDTATYLDGVIKGISKTRK